MVSGPQQPTLQIPRRHWFIRHKIPLLILIIIITINIIAGLFYSLRSIPVVSTTPHGKLEFMESGWVLTGSFIELNETVSFKDVRFSIMDESIGATASLEPLVSREVIEIPGGFNATYFDNNHNEQIEGGDTIRAYNYANGDTFTFTSLPTGGTIASYTVVG